MFNAVLDYTVGILPASKKTGQGGWTSFNAPCCVHRGESADTRKRGGIKTDGTGSVSYHCFNCGYKASYKPGRPLFYKFKKLLEWLGARDSEINRLTIEALRVKDLISPTATDNAKEEIQFEARQLPAESRSFMEMADFVTLTNGYFPKHFNQAVEYIAERKIDMQRYDFYWSSSIEHKMDHRVIVPFKYKGKIVGSSARALVEGIKPKYYSDHPSQFVFNLDEQRPDSKFVIVCEGPFDAMSIDGVAVLSNEISEDQAYLIDELKRDVIVVPDWDKAGRILIQQAIDYGWSVSFPVWRETCKDINEAVIKYGKLFVLKAILDATESNPLKIKLKKLNY